MKKLGILVLACITALNLWAEKFKIGKFRFETITPTTVKLIGADKDITNVFLSETIEYKGNSYTLTYIGSEAFYGCESLTSITFEGMVEQWDKIELGNCWSSNVPTGVVHCTDGDVER